MQWVFGVMAFLAFIMAAIDLMGAALNRWHINKIRDWVNVHDDVITEHAEQLEEIQRAISKVE